MNKKIIPAIIAKNQNELDDRLSKVLPYVEVVQLDVMDDRFVPNTSLFFDFSLPETSVQFEAHLMVQNPEEWVEKFGAKVDTVLVHCESDFDVDRIIEVVKRQGKRFGLVLNPETPVDRLSGVIERLDQVLIMTVKPGFYGSPFLPEMVEKIQMLRAMKPMLDIEVDGGITDKTIDVVDQAGANLFVSGSYIVKAEDVAGAIQNLKRLVG